MTRIAPIDLNKADQDTRDTLDAVKRKLGVLPNMFTTFAHAPAALKAYLGLAETLAGGSLTTQQGEQVAVAIAQQNQCEYCLSAHAVLGKGAGLKDHDIALAREGKAEQAETAALVALALEITRNHGGISDEALEAARSAGLSEGQIVEVVAHVALNTLTNYLNRVAGTEIDFPLLSLTEAA